jgi:hypothetical protein
MLNTIFNIWNIHFKVLKKGFQLLMVVLKTKTKTRARKQQRLISGIWLPVGGRNHWTDIRC